jgi:hypothetical protein
MIDLQLSPARTTKHLKAIFSKKISLALPYKLEKPTIFAENYQDIKIQEL